LRPVASLVFTSLNDSADNWSVPAKGGGGDWAVPEKDGTGDEVIDVVVVVAEYDMLVRMVNV